MGLLITGAVLVLLGGGAFVLAGERPLATPAVAPYGDFCQKCTNYGFGKDQVGHHEAVLAIEAYFHTRGFQLGHITGRGRFITVDVLKHGRLVDIIVFDKKTGRIRSIF